MSEKEYDAWLADEEKWQAAEREIYERVSKEAANWKAQWPNHCVDCEGWGGAHSIVKVDFGPGGLEEYEPCHCTEDGTCPRCGEPGVLDPDSAEGPCKRCGWNHDDGCPRY